MKTAVICAFAVAAVLAAAPAQANNFTSVNVCEPKGAFRNVQAEGINFETGEIFRSELRTTEPDQFPDWDRDCQVFNDFLTGTNVTIRWTNSDTFNDFNQTCLAAPHFAYVVSVNELTRKQPTN
ncbi:MAG: hypothetical protein BJ554DRAFT_6992 [Olpidium bornovanus]|uniref:Uncharacterized protein n=1 Tax=Olpidium bornovanus TaxID=278681 RepID=A0A8H7ZWV7_9FUNG|nr:MAG: hypothetical protein BJ554DRAFT_6992 [Olpidium bornovanus]